MDSVPNSSASVDKSRVLDVKPIRSLIPVFPNAPSDAPNFTNASPFGPFPPGFSPFYPFGISQSSQTQPDLNHQVPPPMRTPLGPTPIRTFRNSEPSEFNGDTGPRKTGRSRGSRQGANVDGASLDEDGDYDKKRTSRGSVKMKKKKNLDMGISESIVGCSAPGMSSIIGISPPAREEGNRDVVNCVLMTFDALRRRLSQLEDVKELRSGIIKRADLRAGAILMTTGFRTNMRKRIGIVPGVEIGDIFFFRMEMCVVGLHAQSMGGIDYMNYRDDFEDELVALSIVSSGGYDDNAEDSDVLIYSGQGGNLNNKDKQATDQKLERGNLALERSLRRANEVRVIRGVKDAITTARVYVYDGLYKIQESWIERAKSGCNIFKYKLVRIPGQPGAFSVWKSIEKWKEGLSTRAGLVLPDLTSGAESISVSLVNDVDDEKGPSYFNYFPTLKYSKTFVLSQPSFGCNCRNSCTPGDPNCSCIRKNDGDFPYTATGILVSRKPLVYECGPTCPCFPNCKNRVSQTGLKVRLEVFKTKDRGWGLRSWDPIRAGTFICEYAGEVIEKAEVNKNGDGGESDEYLFDTTRVFDSFKWNCDPVLLEEESSDGSPSEDYRLPFPLIISSKNIGNVARFMNHSCSPNVFWQPVQYEHNDQSFLHVAFFAIKHVPPLTELTFDYGISNPDAAEGNSAYHRKKKCLCGSQKCRGYFG